ncbi:MAG: hypothetical protein GEV28_40690 [Actinophytocola sp.]|uniref:hypothetical protein n=1 Tax=Actinophytocola sp. TaxID=1872138 RepID=UPI00132A3F10|nr:hypothetical protein [Actinophytocola sp.]MPZ86355.1 hypothetical protein [Actinophytocola sp.]
MGWDEFYRRRDALDTAVDAALERDELVVPDLFDGPDELLLALHHRWALRLASRVELATLDAGADPVDAVGAAWRETAAADPALRRVLDEHADRPALRAAALAERRMLATATGLADPSDGPDEQAAVGAAFLALVRSGPQRTVRRNPVERLLRRLVPTA